MGIILQGIGGNKYSFDGPYYSLSSLEDNSGVYAILCSDNTVVDVGESAGVKSREGGHDRKDCWNRKCGNSIKYAVCYIPYGHKPSRTAIVQDIRGYYSNLCGKR